MLSLLFASGVVTTNAATIDVITSARTFEIVPDVIPMLSPTPLELKVMYDAPAIDYMVCGETYSAPAAMFALDTDTNNSFVEPVAARSFRKTAGAAEEQSDYFKYTPNFWWDAKEDTKYILMLVDPFKLYDGNSDYSPYVSHMMITDINGSDITTGTAVNPYLGPATDTAKRHNRYTFVLYEQPAGFMIEAAEMETIQLRAAFDLDAFIATHSLGDAVAVNWMFVATDPFAIKEAIALGFDVEANTCVTAKAAEFNGIVPLVVPVLDSNPIDLAVTFDQPDITYDFCGESMWAMGGTYDLVALGKNELEPVNTRSYRDVNQNDTDYFQYMPMISWVPNTADQKYILMLVDPLFIHGPMSPAWGYGPYFLHMMIYDIVGSDISTGTAVAPFLGSGNTEQTQNKYTFVLYEQPSDFAINATELVALDNRLGFNLPEFNTKHDLLEAKGINWMFVATKTDMFAARQVMDLFDLACPAEASSTASSTEASSTTEMSSTTMASSTASSTEASSTTEMSSTTMDANSTSPTSTTTPAVNSATSIVVVSVSAFVAMVLAL